MTAKESHPSIDIRPASAADCRFVWETNNHPSVREQSINTESIAWADHQTWYAGVLDSDDCLLWIAEVDDVAIGLVRFDVDRSHGTAEISVALAPDSRGRGLGRRLIADATCNACTIENLETVIAHIRPDNQASVRAFEYAGYRPAGSETVRGVDLLRYDYDIRSLDC